MCLALPGQIVAIDGMEAAVLVGGMTRRAGVQLCPGARVGDYVLVKTGLVVDVLPEAEATDLMSFFAEMVAVLSQDDTSPEMNDGAS
jgi:hydrogenase expression/formation protein HypC